MSFPPPEPAEYAWRVESAARVCQRLLQAAGRPDGRPSIIAVDGRSGSGKSTVSELIARIMPGTAIVHTDDVAWHHSFFDWSDLLIGGVLTPLHEGMAVRYRPPAWDERGREGAITVPRCPVVLVEGVGSGRRNLRPWIDALVWVHSDWQVARTRGIERDGGTREAEEFWMTWEKQEIPFLATERPWDRAGLIVSGTPAVSHDPDREMVVSFRCGRSA